MKARPSSIFCGFSSASLARSKVSRSGPCADIMLWSEPPPGTKPPLPAVFASYAPSIRPMYSLITLRWKYGGRKVSSPTSQRGAKTTKSTPARPGVSDGDVSTVKIDGSGWS